MPEGMEKMHFYYPWENGKYEKALNEMKKFFEKDKRSRNIAELRKKL